LRRGDCTALRSVAAIDGAKFNGSKGLNWAVDEFADPALFPGVILDWK
jgi:hypothetical protein